MSDRPAYSGVFERDRIRTLAPLTLPSPMTREWAWGDGAGRGVKVAVIDSGIDASHPAVGGVVNGYVSVDEGSSGPVYDTRPHDDVFGHGTACAGIIRSLAPACELYSVRVLGPSLSGRGGIFASGLRWAIENGMHVCNLSLGTTKRDFFGILHELADQAYFRNAMLVTAANNMAVPSFPSVYASVISVASHDEPDPYRLYYNPAPPVEFGALGIDVRVAWKNGEWITATGNSFAAPHVAGIAAKILGRHPGVNVFQLKSILWSLCANVAGAPSSPTRPAGDAKESPV
ncbi:MAG: S8 family serine peptidase [Thermomicrobiales bacterium]|nr:S8 family serine peptidase [Thermomicrobiales bacterium]